MKRCSPDGSAAGCLRAVDKGESPSQALVHPPAEIRRQGIEPARPSRAVPGRRGGLLASAPAPLVSTYAYVIPLIGAVIGATVLDEPLWAGALVGAALVLGAVALELRGR